MKVSGVASWLPVAILLAAVQLRGQAQPASPQPLYRQHFVGTVRMDQTATPSALKQIRALQESKALYEYAAQRVAQAPFRVFQSEIAGGARDQANLFRPLLDDWLKAESILELRGPTNRVEIVLAVQLADERAKLWSTNLWQAAVGWKLGSLTATRVEGAPGWELKKKAGPNTFQLVRAGQWLVLGLGYDRLSLLPALVQQTVKAGRPAPALKEGWLEVDADCPRLTGRFPILGLLQAPPARLLVTPKGEGLRSTVQFASTQKFNWTFEPWRIPTNFITEPLVSFTVAQGIAPTLQRMKVVPDLGIKPLPNQVCLWGQVNEHVQTCVAFPILDGSNALNRLQPRLESLFQAYLPGTSADFKWLTNKSGLYYAGAPFVLPTLRSLKTGGQEFLAGSLFPVTSRGKPAPPELFAQLAGQKNLMYYDWEITGERLSQSHRFYQLLSIASKRGLSPSDQPVAKWVGAASKLLKNTGTKLAQTGPTQLELVRNSEVGLSGFELATLLRWIESPGFPLSFDPPLPGAGRTSKPAAQAPPKPTAK